VAFVADGLRSVTVQLRSWEKETLFEEIRETQEAMCESPMAHSDEEEWDLQDGW